MRSTAAIKHAIELVKLIEESGPPPPALEHMSQMPKEVIDVLHWVLEDHSRFGDFLAMIESVRFMWDPPKEKNAHTP